MKYVSFRITNFRGINDLTLKLKSRSEHKIVTLVGLNESGKTTILEAINQFSSNPENLEPLNIEGYKIPDPHSVIPVAKKGNFNGKSTLSTTLYLEEQDWRSVEKRLYNEFKLQVKRTSDYLKVLQTKNFVDSKYDPIRSKNNWELPFKVKRKQATNWRGVKTDEFKAIVQHLRKLIPGILYFPNFLFNVPERIYLDEIPPTENADAHEYYKRMLQDVLDSLSDDLSLDKHIVQRAKSDDSHDKSALDQVLLDLSRQIGFKVFSVWDRLFRGGRQGPDLRRVQVKTETDDAGRHFLSMYIEDADGNFLISERSLGFRWFFVFLLFTEFRKSREGSSRNILFMFDEPASNLHPSAQSLLLEQFQSMSKECSIIYTTHSHYLINPEWLEATYIIKNTGIDYSQPIDDFKAKQTNVTATPYREFVARNPNQTSYFKPVLDVLEWVPSDLEMIPNAVFVEGKNDFYFGNYLSLLCGEQGQISFLPAGGAGSHEPLLDLYIGWGRPFIVVLDSDAEGEAQKKRYVQKYGSWIEERIFTLGDLNEIWRGRELEKVIGENDRLRILRATERDEYSKKEFNRAVQELLSTKRRVDLTKPGKKAAESFVNRIRGLFP